MSFNLKKYTEQTGLNMKEKTVTAEMAPSNDGGDEIDDFLGGDFLGDDPSGKTEEDNLSAMTTGDLKAACSRKFQSMDFKQMSNAFLKASQITGRDSEATQAIVDVAQQTNKNVANPKDQEYSSELNNMVMLTEQVFALIINMSKEQLAEFYTFMKEL